MNNMIRGVLVALTMATSQFASASTVTYSFEYKPEAGADIYISSMILGVPDNFTGTVYDDLYGIYELYGSGPRPSDVWASGIWIDRNSDPDGFSYKNPAAGISFFEQSHNLIFWGLGNYWKFENGEVVGWSIGASAFKGSNAVLVNDSIGGTWVKSEYVISAVPEPSSYAMILLGLTGLGLIARRRQLKKDHGYNTFIRHQ